MSQPPDPLKSFDRVAHCYDDTRGIPPEAARAIGDAIAAMARDVSPSPRLLEVGIGTGRIAVPLAEAGVRVTGIDISPNMLAVLREKRRDIDVLLAEAARPPLRDAAFDAALFVHILHLVPDAEATLRATVRLVDPAASSSSASTRAASVSASRPTPSSPAPSRRSRTSPSRRATPTTRRAPPPSASCANSAPP